ncbi:efflux RND transporter periplasmic adaptor subunit [Agarivorans sp. MS3-6]|uniref:efflux RND transporter periplasmic adaptor subunit n=1 Tax=Agarivorans sp. TSD2052 TaxID=2937286 RepID=UPI00200ECCAA|nr:efflux RND transporter periplasmic adaptor subunit [Agarivorans sp. TSD2052]UPW18965.1 efflux RND transporter periplasmic adaptor subunit [Agarivorans sp. TSD2052]
MAKLLRLSLPLIVIIIGIAVSQYIKANKPEAQRKPKAQIAKLSVEVSPLQAQDYVAKVNSYGSIQAHTEANLISQVAGSITYVAANFREGAFFEKGEVLLKIDARDYQNAITIAEAELQTTQLQLAEESAKVEQALRDWKRLGKGKPANDLVLRKPQLAAQQAASASAKAKLTKAKLDLERTIIRAPYAGRIIDKNVELGEYVSSGTKLASSYAIDYLEIRLPLSSREQSVLSIPENYRQRDSSEAKPEVQVSTQFGNKQFSWQAQIERSEAALDSSSRQLFVVAQIDDPYGPANEDKPPLKIGQFVSASITGNTLNNVFVIPRSALYSDQQVIILEDGLLQRKSVDVVWQDPQHFIIEGGIENGQVLVTTPLGRVISGTPAQAVGE